MSLPLVRLSGTPYEQGARHGQQLRERVRQNVAVYFDRFAREVQLAPADVLARARRCRADVEARNEDYAAAMRGVADGAGIDLDRIVALNVRYELLYDRFGAIAMADGCTSFAVSPAAAASGHLLLGQNWDWIPEVKGAVLHTIEPDGLETLSFTEAGIVGGKIGLNSAGLGLAINGLSTTADDWERLGTPFHARCFEILRRRDLDAAVRVVTGSPRACATNFLIAQVPDRVANVEAAPDSVYVAGWVDRWLVHANHFVVPDILGVVETPSERRPISCHRQGRLQELLATGSPVTVEDVQRYLRDHEGFPDSICRHEDPAEPEEERYATVASVVMDLHERVLSIADGPPCHGVYDSIRLE